ncbi:MAG: hypothetical protein LBN29_06525 [Mediterranea sp.]|jgi:hypothetical protein|nr:hypothetical protein [Mediterranea sp.]
MKKYLFILWALGCLTGCGDDAVNQNIADIQVEVTSTDVPSTAAGATGTIEVATPGFTAKSDQDWCAISVNGQTVTVTTAPNESVISRDALVTLTAGTKTNYVPIKQNGVTLLSGDLHTLDGKGEEMDVTLTGDYPFTITGNNAADWLTATLVDGVLTLTAAENTNTTDSRTATLTLSPTLPSGKVILFPLYVTQDANPDYVPPLPSYTLPLSYDDYIGEYLMAYSTSYDDPTPVNTIHVEIVADETGVSYTLKGLFTDQSVGKGGVPLTFDTDKGTLVYENGLIGTDTALNRDLWGCTLYTDANTSSTSSSNSLESGQFDVSKGLLFQLVTRTVSGSHEGVAGIYLRTYAVGTTSSGAAYSTGGVEETGKFMYATFTKVR